MFANLFLGRTDNIDIRYAAAVALLFNVFMTIVAIISIMITVPKGKKESA
jgi:DHA2 family multidrug resistance protein-like MFS transporter